MIQRQSRRRGFAGVTAAAAFTLAFALSPAVFSATPAEAKAHADAERGMTQLMNGKPDAAIEQFQAAVKDDPSSPLGDVLQADALWWKIYYSTANLIDPDVFDVVTSYHTPWDADFEREVDTAIRKSQANIRGQRDVARNDLYEGMAYALEARLAGLRAHDLATARAGKKMRPLLLAALQLDPNLTDAYAGTGLYNYFVDTLPSIVKMLRFFIGLPAGNRALGIEQMEKAAQHGDFTRAEAQFYLAKDYTRRNELQFGKALGLFEQLAREYPENPFWGMMIASCQMRMGKTAEGDALYRRVYHQTAGDSSAAEKAVHNQVAEALRRLHPQEQF